MKYYIKEDALKKLIKLTVFILSVSAVVNAQQDYLKNISWNSELRTRFVDQTGTDRNRIGNGGFKSENKNRSRWRNVLRGTVNLSDEWGIDADFRILRNGTHTYNAPDGKNFKKTGIQEAWETEISLSKSIKIASLDTTWTLGWENKTNRAKQKRNSSGVWSNNISGKMNTVGISNEFYFGPSATFNVLGTKLDTTLQLAHVSIKGNRAGDYYRTGENFTDGKGKGWGINFNIVNSKNLIKAKWGSIGYSLSLTNKFRDMNGTLTGTGKKAGSNVYLDYIIDLGYSTPEYKGFYAKASVNNEWEKYTAASGYENTFALWTTVGYKKNFSTSSGTFIIHPTIRYSPVYKYTVKDADSKDRKTVEYNELIAGITFGYTHKK